MTQPPETADTLAQRRAVIQREMAWHDQEAEKRETLDFLYASPAFDDIIADTLAFLQPLPGARVLDLASGEGKETVWMARQGWQVISMDLSHAQLKRARERVQQMAPGLPVLFVQANAERLPFAAGTFPAIYGKAIIHHLDLTIAAAELTRALTPGGRATFTEPMAHHPLFWLGRRLTPRLRTPDEHPLTHAEFSDFVRRFDDGRLHEAYLLAVLAYPLRLLPGGERPFRWLLTRLKQLDHWLLTRIPALRPFAWYDTAYVQKGTNHDF